MNDLYVRGRVWPFRNQYKNIRSFALKLSVLSFALINVLFCVCLAHAGQREIFPAATGVALSTDSIKPLKIGDTIPEALWNLPLQMVKAGQEGSSYVKLSDYRGKLIILDFMHTACSSCIAKLPLLDSLRDAYQDRLEILVLTPEKESRISEFVKYNKIFSNVRLPIVVNDTVLKRYWPHRVVSHFVWIDTVVKAITFPDYVTNVNVEKLFTDGAIGWKVKRDVSFSYGDDFFGLNEHLSELIPGKRVNFYSTITPYIAGVSQRKVLATDSVDHSSKVQLINYSIAYLYEWACRENAPISKSHFILPKDSVDKLIYVPSLGYREDWTERNTYCYDARFPLNMSLKDIKAKMRADLDAYFHMTGRREHRLTPAYELVALRGAENASSEIKGELFTQPESLLYVLNRTLVSTPVLTGADFPEKISIRLDKGILDNVHKLRQSLQRQGYEFRAIERVLPVLVIKEKTQNN